MMPEPELAEFHLQDLSMNQRLQPELLSPGWNLLCWEPAVLIPCAMTPVLSELLASSFKRGLGRSGGAGGAGKGIAAPG